MVHYRTARSYGYGNSTLLLARHILLGDNVIQDGQLLIRPGWWIHTLDTYLFQTLAWLSVENNGEIDDGFHAMHQSDPRITRRTNRGILFFKKKYRLLVKDIWPTLFTISHTWYESRPRLYLSKTLRQLNFKEEEEIPNDTWVHFREGDDTIGRGINPLSNPPLIWDVWLAAPICFNRVVWEVS